MNFDKLNKKFQMTDEVRNDLKTVNKELNSQIEQFEKEITETIAQNNKYILELKKLRTEITCNEVQKSNENLNLQIETLVEKEIVISMKPPK